MRYTQPINLKLNGEGVGEDHALVGIARTFLGTMMEINSSDPTGQRWTRRLTDGSIITGYIPATGMLPIVNIFTPVKEEAKEFSVSRDEGIIALSLSDDAVDGWGHPLLEESSNDPLGILLGTPSGNYPDSLFTYKKKDENEQDGVSSLAERHPYRIPEDYPVADFYTDYKSDSDYLVWTMKEVSSNFHTNRYNSLGNSKEVYVRGSLFATIPGGDLLGVLTLPVPERDIAKVGAAKWLYTLSSNPNRDELTLRRRVYKPLPPERDGGEYGEVTNPDGWEDLAVYELGTIFPEAIYLGVAAGSATTGLFSIHIGYRLSDLPGISLSVSGYTVPMGYLEIDVESQDNNYYGELTINLIDSTSLPSEFVPSPHGPERDDWTKSSTSWGAISPRVCMVDYKEDELVTALIHSPSYLESSIIGGLPVLEIDRPPYPIKEATANEVILTLPNNKTITIFSGLPKVELESKTLPTIGYSWVERTDYTLKTTSLYGLDMRFETKIYTYTLESVIYFEKASNNSIHNASLSATETLKVIGEPGTIYQKTHSPPLATASEPDFRLEEDQINNFTSYYDFPVSHTGDIFITKATPGFSQMIADHYGEWFISFPELVDDPDGSGQQFTSQYLGERMYSLLVNWRYSLPYVKQDDTWVNIYIPEDLPNYELPLERLGDATVVGINAHYENLKLI